LSQVDDEGAPQRAIEHRIACVVFKITDHDGGVLRDPWPRPVHPEPEADNDGDEDRKNCPKRSLFVPFP
jgi:hypothetical protein